MVMTSDMWLGLYNPNALKDREMILLNEIRTKNNRSMIDRYDTILDKHKEEKLCAK